MHHELSNFGQPHKKRYSVTLKRLCVYCEKRKESFNKFRLVLLFESLISLRTSQYVSRFRFWHSWFIFVTSQVLISARSLAILFMILLGISQALQKFSDTTSNYALHKISNLLLCFQGLPLTSAPHTHTNTHTHT